MTKETELELRKKGMMTVKCNTCPANLLLEMNAHPTASNTYRIQVVV